MSRIYSKATNDEADKLVQDILDYMETVSGKENWKELVLQKIDKMRREREEHKESIKKVYEEHPWDFSEEKKRPIFISDGSLEICPVRLEDKPFYCRIRRFWMRENGMMKMAEILDDDVIWKQIRLDRTFCCIVKLDGNPIGYVMLQDTRESIWEIVAEFDPEYCNKGFGSTSTLLFLKAVQEITMKDLYRAKVEVENIASQKCLAKLGAELVGITNGAIEDEDEKTRFENENLDRIDANMVLLAEQLGIEPRKLLSHVLEYHILI